MPTIYSVSNNSLSMLNWYFSLSNCHRYHKGNYRYHIYAAFQTAVDSEVYNIFTARGKEFLEWEKRLQAASEVSNSVPLTENDFTVTLSTCTSDSSVRCVVIGKCVSSTKPVKAAKTAS